MALRSFFFGLLGLAISAGLIYFAKPIAKALLSNFGIETEETRPYAATVIKATGNAYYKPFGRGMFAKLNTDHRLNLKDEIKTERDSRIHLKFKSGYEIEVLEESQAILDIWSSQGSNKPRYISFVRGDYRLLQKGEPGRLYIVKGSEVFAPSRPPVKNKKSFKIDPSTVSKPNNKEVDKLPDSAPADKTTTMPNKMPDKLASKGSETLSSAYIESVFLSRSQLFRRCQLTSVRDNKAATGNMLFSLVIEPNGRVNSVKLLQKNLNNTSLESCVSSVIERTKFKPFSGTAISLSYPLNFQ